MHPHQATKHLRSALLFAGVSGSLLLLLPAAARATETPSQLFYKKLGPNRQVFERTVSSVGRSMTFTDGQGSPHVLNCFASYLPPSTGYSAQQAEHLGKAYETLMATMGTDLRAGVVAVRKLAREWQITLGPQIKHKLTCMTQTLRDLNNCNHVVYDATGKRLRNTCVVTIYQLKNGGGFGGSAPTDSFHGGEPYFPNRQVRGVAHDLTVLMAQITGAKISGQPIAIPQ